MNGKTHNSACFVVQSLGILLTIFEFNWSSCLGKQRANSITIFLFHMCIILDFKLPSKYVRVRSISFMLFFCSSSDCGLTNKRSQLLMWDQNRKSKHLGIPDFLFYMVLFLVFVFFLLPWICAVNAWPIFVTLQMVWIRTRWSCFRVKLQ